MQEFQQIGYSISYTTRPQRVGEIPGQDYHFVDAEEFVKLQQTGFFAEWAEVHGNFYGTPLKSTLDILGTGRDVLFDIDVQGAAQLRLTMPTGRYVFILPPSLQILEKRLRGRSLDGEESIKRRLKAACNEIREARWFDAWIVNDGLERAYDELRSVYIAATLVPKRRPLILRNLLNGHVAL